MAIGLGKGSRAMEQFGVHNPAVELNTIGLGGAASVRYNLGAARLYEEAIRFAPSRVSIQAARRKISSSSATQIPKARFGGITTNR
jgi:phosphoenolpyruvate carboxykinase (ATP)